MKFHNAKQFSDGPKKVLVDIDETICFYPNERKYNLAVPNKENIAKINKLYNDGWHVIYWTARGSMSGIDFKEFTINQLNDWDCKYHDVITGTDINPKPFYDMIIDDKAKRIEEL
jgi:CMP-N,N'-diacetyllegionaminic acid synthase